MLSQLESATQSFLRTRGTAASIFPTVVLRVHSNARFPVQERANLLYHCSTHAHAAEGCEISCSDKEEW
jgi:hypothetical protein